MKELNEEKSFEQAQIENLMSEYGYTKEQAYIIFNYAWEEGHSSGYNEIIFKINEIVELITDFNKAK